MKYIIPLAVMAATGTGMALPNISGINEQVADFACALLFCVAGFFLVKNIAQYFSTKKVSR